MTYVKSVLVGIAGAFVAAVIWILVTFFLPVEIPMLVGRFIGTGGTAGAYITSDSILAAALVGFVVGFYWQFRRASNRHAA